MIDYHNSQPNFTVIGVNMTYHFKQLSWALLDISPEMLDI